MEKVWFITGASRGFGREFAIAALSRGDRVAATARNVSALAGLGEEFGDRLLALELDVTNRDQVNASIAEAHAKFGRLDVVVNNAGYGLFGAVEEISPSQLHQQLDVNLFGVLHVTQAVLPLMRAQNSGHIVQISTIGGVVAFPALGGYHASKWALEGLTESLAQEVAQFGIKVTMVEPGAFGTDWAGASALHGEPMAEYETLRIAMANAFNPAEIGDPAAAGPAMLKLVDASNPPLRVFFGEQPTQIAPAVYNQRLKTWREWEWLSREAQG